MLVLYVHVHVVCVVNMYMIGTYNIGDFRHILLFSQDFEVWMGRIVLYLGRKFVSFPPLFTDFFYIPLVHVLTAIGLFGVGIQCLISLLMLYKLWAWEDLWLVPDAVITD